MSRLTKFHGLALAIGIAVAGLAAPVLAADTARASATLKVYSGPGSDYRVIGSLRKNTEVELAGCSRNARWCQIREDNGDLGGWVRGSYLVGTAAIMKATPFQFLVNPEFVPNP